MKVAITGGTGCLGYQLIRKLINFGVHIHLLAVPTDPIISSMGKTVRIIRGTLNSPDSLNLLTEDCTVVFHLAGKVHSVPRTEREKENFYRELSMWDFAKSVYGM